MLKRLITGLRLLKRPPFVRYRCGRDLRYEFCRGCEELTGYTSAELNSRDGGWPSIIHADDAERIARQRAGRSAEKGGLIREYRILAKDGQLKWVEDRQTTSFSRRGKFLGAQGILLDITERKERAVEARENAEKYRNLVEYSCDFIWEVNAKGLYSFVSPAVKTTLGFAPEEVVGKTPFDLMSPEDAVRTRLLFAEKVKAREPIIRLENVNVHKDGRLITLETSGVPVLDERGDVVCYRGVDRDVTERKKAEAEREKLLNELQQALNNVNVLRGLLPICSSCKKIRDDRGYWNQIDSYLNAHSEIQFSHGICPECAAKLYPGLA